MAKQTQRLHSDTHGTGILTYLWFLLIAAILAFGWLVRDEEYFTAESGAGYNLGIIGGAMMLLLLLYPLRKASHLMRNMGAVKYWFRFHMILGVLGPVLVLFHANFSFGSMNSRIVLLTALIVAGSGLFGRYFYGKVHYGLYGKKASLLELRKMIESDKGAVKRVLHYAPALQQKLYKFDDLALEVRYSFLGSAIHGIKIAFWSRWLHLVLRFNLRRTIDVAARREKWVGAERKRHTTELRRYIKAHIKGGLKVAEFNIYERMLALWHMFHLPIFILLIIVTAIHIIAVHMY